MLVSIAAALAVGGCSSDKPLDTSEVPAIDTPGSPVAQPPADSSATAPPVPTDGSTSGAPAGQASALKPCAENSSGFIPDELFDRSGCVVVGQFDDNFVLAGSRLWWAGGSVKAIDLKTGQTVFTANDLGTEGEDLRQIIVNGTPAMAAVVHTLDKGDGVTAQKAGIRLVAFPLDATTGTPPVIDTSSPVSKRITFNALEGPLWAKDYMTLDNLPTPLENPKFEEFTVSAKYQLGGHESNRIAVGYASAGPKSLILWADDDALPTQGKQAHYAGYIAIDKSGKTLWKALDTSATDDRSIHQRITWGNYGLHVTMTEKGDVLKVAWIDLSTGKPATPKPADFVGSPMANHGLSSPDGKFLAFTVFVEDPGTDWPYVLNVETGKVTPVDAELPIRLTSIDNTTAYGSSTNGGATVDLATAKASALKSGYGPRAISDTFGVWVDDWGNLLAAPRK